MDLLLGFALGAIIILVISRVIWGKPVTKRHTADNVTNTSKQTRLRKQSDSRSSGYLVGGIVCMLLLAPLVLLGGAWGVGDSPLEPFWPWLVGGISLTIIGITLYIKGRGVMGAMRDPIFIISAVWLVWIYIGTLSSVY